MPESVVVIVLAGLIFSFIIVRMSLKHEERKMAYKAGGEDVQRLEQALAATQAEMTRLRERVQVLEKLATDDDRRLAEEIGRLGQGEGARL